MYIISRLTNCPLESYNKKMIVPVEYLKIARKIVVLTDESASLTIEHDLEKALL